MKNRHIIFIIVFCEFAGTSLWFGGNAVIGSISKDLGIASEGIGYALSSVQFGFIIGTLTYAILGFADRFSPSLVFFISSLAAAVANLFICVFAFDLYSLLLFRFLTGFFLAGIYPIGMKIAADWFPDQLGKALGYLVGALVLGTGFPHLLSSLLSDWDWKYLLSITSSVAAAGATVMLIFVPGGPYRKKNKKFTIKGLWSAMNTKELVRSAFGYFGHMWELYAFWAFVPVILLLHAEALGYDSNVSLNSFLVIALGGVSCVIGGYLALNVGPGKVAFFSLLLSGLCCLVSPFLFGTSHMFFLIFLIFWGMVVIVDSPQLSSLVARHSPKENLGSTLTLVNCVGFAITILSIQLLDYIQGQVAPNYIFLILAPGPLLGLMSIGKLVWTSK